MKRKTLVLLLIATAILIGALTLVTKLYPNVLSSVLAFPLEPLVLGLKAIAKTGPAGNGLAVAVIAALVLIPAVIALRMRGNDKIPEAVSLLALAGMILFAVYGAWNPAAFQNKIVKDAMEDSNALLMVFSLAVWTMFVLFIVLRLIRLFRTGHREQLHRYLRLLLFILCAVIAAGIAATLVSGVISLVKGLPTPEDAALLVAKAIASLAVSLLELIVCFRMLDMLDIVAADEQDKLPEAASRLSRVSCAALAGIALSAALLHIIQILLLPSLTDVKSILDIPLLQIVFVLVILLLSRLLIENKELKDDNSMFI